jgi:prepilin-type N-terminal cleavage/methylation domain-containing protein
MLKLNDKGFSFIEVMIALVVIVIIIGAGFFVFRSHHDATKSSPSSRTTSVLITRENTLSQPGVSNLKKSLSGSRATTLLGDVNSLKPLAGGAGAIYNCPEDDGVEYTLTFTDPSLHATVAATGCQRLTINNKDYITTSKFWSDLSVDIN